MQDETKQGYVYILTNPSFKEDWVKIGKSSRPVDMRSKEFSSFVVTFMPEDKRNASGAYQGSKYFSFKGKVLEELRMEMEKE